jgi:hypothetical protein
VAGESSRAASVVFAIRTNGVRVVFCHGPLQCYVS